MAPQGSGVPFDLAQIHKIGARRSIDRSSLPLRVPTDDRLLRKHGKNALHVTLLHTIPDIKPYAQDEACLSHVNSGHTLELDPECQIACG